MRERLDFLYGPEVGERVHADLLRLLEGFRARIPAREALAEPFGERDALLITYGDSFLEDGRRPLEALDAFARRHLAELVSTIHILPFFPYSSDYGFSVKDFLAVNPELGDWGDVARLHERFKLMFDFVLNHASAEGEWFRAFLRREACLHPLVFNACESLLESTAEDPDSVCTFYEVARTRYAYPEMFTARMIRHVRADEDFEHIDIFDQLLSARATLPFDLADDILDACARLADLLCLWHADIARFYGGFDRPVVRTRHHRLIFSGRYS